MARSVKCPTLSIGSGHDLTGREVCAAVHSLLGILSLPVSTPPPLMRALSLKTNKEKKKEIKIKLMVRCLQDELHQHVKVKAGRPLLHALTS